MRGRGGNLRPFRSLFAARPPRLAAGRCSARLEQAEVRLGLYVTSTDECGRASLDLPDGTYELSIRKDGYEALPMVLEVRSDTTVQVEAIPTLTRAEWEDKLATARKQIAAVEDSFKDKLPAAEEGGMWVFRE